MAFLDNTGLGTVWGRIKTVFGAGFADLVSDSTSVTIKLQNGYGNDLDTVAIPLADSTNSKAGLMSPTEKSKLAGIASGAEVNVQSDWNQTSTNADDFIKNKPTNLSDFTNDEGFITLSDVPPGVAASSTTPKMDGTASVGSETKYAKGDHVHPSDTSRVAKSGDTMTGSLTFDPGKNIVFKTNAVSSASIPAREYAFGTLGASGAGDTAITKIGFTALTSGQSGSVELIHIATPTAIDSATNRAYVDSAVDNKVPTSRKINGYALTSDVNLYFGDIHFSSSNNTSLATALNNKVDKVTGKGLSTNDYTDADQTKVGYVDTGKSVTTYVSEQISSAMTGSAKYKGTVGTGGTVTTLPTSGYKQGDYYVVCSAGTYAGESCEVGDMIFANKDYASGAVAADDWDIVQANITAMTTAEINAICV